MGYRGKLEERERARELRAQSRTLIEIAEELGVSKASVSVWVRDVEFEPRPRNRGHASNKPHPITLRKEAEIERCRQEAEEFVHNGVSEREFLLRGLGLYLGEGAKTEQSGFQLANTDPRVIASCMRWTERFFDVEPNRVAGGR